MGTNERIGENMKTRFVDIKMKEGVCDSFTAYPNDTGKYPAVLFFMDAFGPREYLYSMVQTIAAKGSYVLLPNLFWRTRRAPVIDAPFPLTSDQLPAAHAQLMALIQSFKPEWALEDAAVYLDFLNKQPQVQPGPRYATGYCMGGNLGLRVAAQYPDQFAAVASFHAGRLVTDEPNSPHKLVNKIKARLYFGHADNDKSMPPEAVEKLEAALKASGVRYESELYKGAQHGFTMADIPAYNEAALKKHWEKLFALFT
jgi:carboxymethylenebutenolidase